MNPFQKDKSIPNPSKNPKKSNTNVLMGRAVTDMRYLKSEVNLQKEMDMQKQVLATLYVTWKEYGLGFCDGNQETQLSANTFKIRDTLCFVQKHWRVIVRRTSQQYLRTQMISSKNTSY